MGMSRYVRLMGTRKKQGGNVTEARELGQRLRDMAVFLCRTSNHRSGLSCPLETSVFMDAVPCGSSLVVASQGVAPGYRRPGRYCRSNDQETVIDGDHRYTLV